MLFQSIIAPWCHVSSMTEVARQFHRLQGYCAMGTQVPIDRTKPAITNLNVVLCSGVFSWLQSFCPTYSTLELAPFSTSWMAPTLVMHRKVSFHSICVSYLAWRSWTHRFKKNSRGSKCLQYLIWTSIGAMSKWWELLSSCFILNTQNSLDFERQCRGSRTSSS